MGNGCSGLEAVPAASAFFLYWVSGLFLPSLRRSAPLLYVQAFSWPALFSRSLCSRGGASFAFVVDAERTRQGHDEQRDGDHDRPSARDETKAC